MTLTTQEQEELRICIATEMGWKFGDGRTSAALTAPDGRIVNNQYNEPWRLPEYTTSIDAIQAACLERFKLEYEAYDFNFEIIKRHVEIEKEHWEVWQLTALDWCIAFARTAKIWRFKV